MSWTRWSSDKSLTGAIFLGAKPSLHQPAPAGGVVAGQEQADLPGQPGLRQPEAAAGPPPGGLQGGGQPQSTVRGPGC